MTLMRNKDQLSFPANFQSHNTIMITKKATVFYVADKKNTKISSHFNSATKRLDDTKRALLAQYHLGDKA